MNGISYTALRSVRGPGTDPWWSAARNRDDVPRPIAAMLHGRARVELGPQEAQAALAWAATLESWGDAQPKPLLLFQAERGD